MNELKQSLDQFQTLPTPGSFRLINFDSAEILSGTVAGTFILVVRGTKPYLNMKVNLMPLVYVQQPEYWGIEVIGSLPGIGLPAEAPYTVSIPLEGIRGTKGIEVIGANQCKQLPLNEIMTQYLLPENFKVYVKGESVINHPAPGYEERVLPTVNKYMGNDGGYIACYSRHQEGSIYSVGGGIYVMGQIRLQGKYIGRIFEPKGYEGKDISAAQELKDLCNQTFPSAKGGGWAGGDTGGWFGITNLEGHWILKSGVGTQLLPNTEITAEFKDGKLTGSGGCNQYSASYTVEPLDQTSGKIQIQGIASTKMFCGEEINAQESSYFQALEQVKEYKLTDEGLILPYPSPERYLFFTRMTKKKVLEVLDIEISQELQSITAFGTVNAAGWKNPELILRPLPPDGQIDFVEFDFVAQPPDDPVPQVITPIEAIYSPLPRQGNFRGVRIYASENVKEVVLE